MTIVHITSGDQVFDIEVPKFKFSEQLELVSFVTGLLDDEVGSKIKGITLMENTPNTDINNLNSMQLLIDVITGIMTSSTVDQKMELFKRLIKNCTHRNGAISVPVDMAWFDSNITSLKAGLMLAVECVKVRFSFL